MKTEKIKLSTNITNELTLLVDELLKEKPKKEFSITVYEENSYWSIHWKTDQYLKEYFQVQIWNTNEKYYLLGEHRIEDIPENISEEHFLYEEKTMQRLISITPEIAKKTKEAILKIVNK